MIIDATTPARFRGNAGRRAERHDPEHHLVLPADGLQVSGGGSTIRGLVINRFSGNAIAISGPAAT